MSEMEFDPFAFIILKLLHSRNNEPIRRKILFQKIAFLALRNFNNFFQLADFKPHKFGPYSAPLENISSQLSDLGEIYINRKGSYEITEEGKKYLNNLHRQLQDEESKKMDQKLERVIENIKQDFNEFTTDEILAFIYKSFPKYVEPSMKADKLNYKKIFLKMYEEGKMGISRIAELMGWSYERVYEFVKQNAKKVILR
ncbi:MAG: hypothetical protein ACOC4M_12100 [Promethearchaeia archaeon]